MRTCEEWSVEFDRLYDNIGSGKAPGLTEYEKSVFLTRAQEAVVIALYKGSLGEPFEGDEEVTSYLSSLVRTKTVQPKVWQAPIGGQSPDRPETLTKSSVLFELQDDVLFITYEKCTLEDDRLCGLKVEASVVPVTQDGLWKAMRNPFRRPNERRVLRLSLGEGKEGEDDKLETVRYSELVSKYNVSEYTVRYVARPDPIILSGLSDGVDGLSINGKRNAQTCLLPESLHQAILESAVNAAKSVWK